MRYRTLLLSVLVVLAGCQKEAVDHQAAVDDLAEKVIAEKAEQKKSENLDSTNSRKQDPKAGKKVDISRLAVVKIGDKWGYINHEGEIVIKPQFDGAMMFSDGLAAVNISGKWGYINLGGEIVIEPQFEGAGFFSEGKGHLLGVEGWAIVRIYGKWGYINREGKFFDRVNGFSEGLAPVQIGNKWGYINWEGKIVIEPQFSVATHFSKGLARVRLLNFNLAIINREGKFFDGVGVFSEGLTRVKIGDKWGYVDQGGKIVIELQFNAAGNFSEGLAAIKISDKWGYINHRGEIVIKPQFDDARSFQK